MSRTPVPVVAIDGPSGSGKGTIARSVAAWLGWHYLDSGALYRVVALAAQREGIPLDDATRLADLAAHLDARFEEGGGSHRIWLGGADVTDLLRAEGAGEAASRIARLAPVRAALLGRQRSFARPPGLVADGRDMGTVVFPGARFKLFLTASAEERARRRHKQLRDKGINVSLPALAKEIAERDERDTNRTASPARPASEAIVLDSTDIGIAEVLDQVKRWLIERGIRPVET